MLSLVKPGVSSAHVGSNRGLRGPLRETARSPKDAKDVAEAIGLTLRVLVVLRKIN